MLIIINTQIMKAESSLCFDFTVFPFSYISVNVGGVFFPVVPHLLCKPAVMFHMVRIHLDLQRLDCWLLAEKPGMQAQ